jgi:hypothetical protein
MVSYTGRDQGDANIGIAGLNLFNKATYQISAKQTGLSIQFLFNLIIGISIATSVIIFMYGAFGGILTTLSISETIKAKQNMINAITGLMIILSTWLIINTINPDLLRLPFFNNISLGSTMETTGPGASLE